MKRCLDLKEAREYKDRIKGQTLLSVYPERLSCVCRELLFAILVRSNFIIFNCKSIIKFLLNTKIYIFYMYFP